MFDLNEMPEQPVNDFGAENGANAIASSATSRVNEEDAITGCKSPLLRSCSIKKGGISSSEIAVSGLMESPTLEPEIPSLKCSTSSSLSLEKALPRQPSVSMSVAPISQQQDLESEDHEADGAKAVEVFASTLPQSELHRRNDQQLERDLITSTGKIAFHFLGGCLEDANTLSAAARSVDQHSRNNIDEDLTNTISSVKSNLEPQTALEVSAIGLSLGGIFCKSSPRQASDPLRHGSKGSDLLLTTANAPQHVQLVSRRSQDLSPFWCGNLHLDNSALVMPIVAYCLGIMTPDSRLRRLPSTLRLKRHLTLEELERVLQKGLAEPLMQFRSSEGASADEVKGFHLMVKSLSPGLGPSLDTSFSGQGMGPHDSSSEGKIASLAALISWEEVNFDAKLCLISLSSIQQVHKFCKSSLILSALEDVNALDPESLYGIICHSTSGLSNEKVDPLKMNKSQREGGTVTFSSDKVSVANMAFAERGKATGTTDRAANPSNKKPHRTPSEFLSKSASMEPIRVSSRDDFGFEEPGKGTKRRYQKQLSAVDRFQEVTGKHHSRYDNGAHEPDEDETGPSKSQQQVDLKQRERGNWKHERPSQRQESRNDRLKNTLRRNKDETDSLKQKCKQHQRHFHCEGEKGKGGKLPASEANHHRNQDKASHKAREKGRSKDLEDMKQKLPFERNLSDFKNKLSLLHRISPDQDMGKTKKKRDREPEKVQVVTVKRIRESEATASSHSGQCEKSLTNDLTCKPESQRMTNQSRKKESVLAAETDCVKPDKKFHVVDTRMSNHQKTDAVMVGGMHCDVLDEKIVIPVHRSGVVDELTRMNDGRFGASISMLSASDINTNPNLLVISSEKNVTAFDGAPTISDETLGDSLLDKVKDEKLESGLEFSVDVSDKETRAWLLSKQNALYLQEEFGVLTAISPDLLNSDIDSKADSQTSPLQVKISVIPSEPCDLIESKWFLDQAAIMVKTIASRGVFIKCLWYEGPVQIHLGDGAPSIPVIVKKIKGEDGKNLEKLQDMTGVMIGVVLRKSGSGALNEMEPLSRPRFIGLRLKCVRRKGLLEAWKETEALLESVADHFSKELATHIATHIVDLQASTVHTNEASSNNGFPSGAIVATKELLSNSPVKEEGVLEYQSTRKLFRLDSAHDVPNKISLCKEEPEVSLSLEQEVAARPIYVSNLSDHMTPIKIENIFNKALKGKLEPSANCGDLAELVADVKYIPEKSCALVSLANDFLRNATLELYAEDKMAFQGMNVESNPSEQGSAFARLGARNIGSVNRVRGRAATVVKNQEENKGSLHNAGDNDNDNISDCSSDPLYMENVAPRSDTFPERPRPLFLSELMRNASAPAIKQLFEDIITTYIGTSLVSAGGRQLILDVRYIPSRGCAFVDLATPELVDFMLDLHSRRPEVFMNMKMELGRKTMSYSADEEMGGRSNVRLLGKSSFSSQTYGYSLSLASRKRMETRGNCSFDMEDSDECDNLLWLHARMKKQRSDPERTIYADRLPENASEGMIRKIFERVLSQKLPQEEVDALGEHMITEVRHVPTKYCAFVVFATEGLTRTVLHMFSQDENAFESMRLKPHFHSRMEDHYKDDLQEYDDIVHTASLRERVASLDNDRAKACPLDPHEARARSLAHRAIAASAFREVDRRRSVYVDKIPEGLSESSMTDIFEKALQHKKRSVHRPMVSQVAYFRDKFDPGKLCAFVEVKTEEGTQQLIDIYNSNQDAFQGMRVRPGFKYTH